MTRHQRLKAVVASASDNTSVCRQCLWLLARRTEPLPALQCGPRFYRPHLSPRSVFQPSRRSYASAADKPVPEIPISSSLGEQHVLVKNLFTEITQDPARVRRIPDEKSIMRVLTTYERLVEKLVAESHSPLAKLRNRGTNGSANATSAMLKSIDKPRIGSKVSTEDLLADISAKATQIVETPSIFITAPVLKSYVNLQSQLHRPENFPSIFELYRNKPAPRMSDREPYMTLAAPTPNAPSVAVDPQVASTALSAAIELHSLPLCLDIIESTYCAPSYAKSKVLRNGIVPIAGAALAPMAAYALASQFALLQNTMDSAHATTVAMAGIMTYVATVGSMGYIAITTSNDQMIRVTWASGLPLWERWVREEERAAVDKVAQAWGFKNRARWGDEEGWEWDSLREWAGLRGMILDKVELMQGMQ
ncbi:hypothetical protein ANO11243_057330 [Dothideomycetidae sp. 11243]|nr:hypothetical protein ANO11243_057330 [fungal sp. No.11243]